MKKVLMSHISKTATSTTVGQWKSNTKPPPGCQLAPWLLDDLEQS